MGCTHSTSCRLKNRAMDHLGHFVAIYLPPLLIRMSQRTSIPDSSTLVVYMLLWIYQWGLIGDVGYRKTGFPTVVSNNSSLKGKNYFSWKIENSCPLHEVNTTKNQKSVFWSMRIINLISRHSKQFIVMIWVTDQPKPYKCLIICHQLTRVTRVSRVEHEFLFNLAKSIASCHIVQLIITGSKPSAFIPYYMLTKMQSFLCHFRLQTSVAVACKTATQ